MSSRALVALALSLFAVVVSGCSTTGSAPARPIRALLITGGCCHNYAFQSAQLTNAVGHHARVEWTIVNEGGTGTRAEIPLYGDPAWATTYDVSVPNEGFPATRPPGRPSRAERPPQRTMPGGRPWGSAAPCTPAVRRMWTIGAISSASPAAATTT